MCINCSNEVTRYTGTGECDRCYKYRERTGVKWKPVNRTCYFCSKPSESNLHPGDIRKIPPVDGNVIHEMPRSNNELGSIKLCMNHRAKFRRQTNCTGITEICGDSKLRRGTLCSKCISRKNSIRINIKKIIAIIDNKQIEQNIENKLEEAYDYINAKHGIEVKNNSFETSLKSRLKLLPNLSVSKYIDEEWNKEMLSIEISVENY